ncbi:MAG: large subunit ribosomal protein L5 [Candidatus Omnitrophota bacterium]|jgi:large subunit ribosomal protein L5
MFKNRDLTNIEKKYHEEVVPALTKKFGYKNKHNIPRLVKCIVNMGVGKASEDAKLLEDAAKELGLITGQKPVIRKSKKSISNFKIRQGQSIGCAVTLRRQMMYEFFDRLVNIALPRVRDFRGIKKTSFDNTGNYSFGLTEQSIFPEVPSDRVIRVQGMDITFVTSAKTNEECLWLLSLLGVPYRDGDKVYRPGEVN